MIVVLVFLIVSIRPIVFDAFDPVFMQVVDKRRFYYQSCFWAMVIILLVAASMTIGTLMAPWVNHVAGPDSSNFGDTYS